ncbi:MAG: hypothetical protein J5I98_05615 [Phaeodactylibacter sp.]|nr:hypothetical protein [Phaeodactylibacter sp.]
MRIPIFFLSLALLAAACTGGGQPSRGEEEKFTAEQQAAQQQAFQKMMDAHDVAMEKIIEMNRVARSLKPYLDSLDDKRKLEEVNIAITRLETADEAMMQWMANSPKLGKLRDTLQHDQIIALLKSEQENINKIGEEMTSSLENGQAVLAGIQEPQKED